MNPYSDLSREDLNAKIKHQERLIADANAAISAAYRELYYLTEALEYHDLDRSTPHHNGVGIASLEGKSVPPAVAGGSVQRRTRR